ncbi:MAG: hypothetical protein ACLQOO_16995 [Terriglobia bacterium]
MATTTTQGVPARGSSLKWIRGTLILLAVIVVARFTTEVAGVSHDITRFISSSVATLLAAIYLGAVAPLRGITRFPRLILPAVVVSAWTGGWVILFTIISAVFRLERSHFAEPEDYGNWGHLLGQHLLGHVIEIVVVSIVVLLLMAVPFLLRGWPIVVGPVAMLGAVVIMRFWVEAMSLEPLRFAAWSSTIAVLFCAFYLGGVGPKMGLDSLLGPALIIGWAWRFWVYLATVFAALVPFFKTHFFDPTGDRIGMRLARSLGGAIVEGFVAGLIVWGIAAWIRRATKVSG